MGDLFHNLAVDDELASLRAELRHHDHLYHVLGRPEISDGAYDELFRRLQELEARFPDRIVPDSPTQRVGGEPLSELRTVPHVAPMLSLDSSQNPDDVRRFDERIRRAIPDRAIHYLLEPKLDGISIELVYVEGALVRGVTRGNGRAGEEVTANLRTIPTVPLRLQEWEGPPPPLLAVRGEVLMSLSAFERLNEGILEEGGEPYSNPRNATSGAIRQLDPGVAARRPLECQVYDILAVEGRTFRSDFDGVAALRGWGFRVPDRVERVDSLEGVFDYHAGFARDRDHLDVEIDGIVIKLDDLDERTDLGMTSHHPRWAMAFKFEPRREITRLDRIVVQVGRTGVLTPVALLRPVEVGGVTVSRATLHNREEVERRDIREGDRVRVQRAGDVIPQVVESLPEEGRPRAEPFRMPEACPSCGGALEERGPFTLCPNRFACPAQLRGRLIHLASRSALDIEGLGSETAGLLLEHGLVRELPDLFRVRAEELLPLPGFAEKSAENLVAAIQRRRSTELARFLFGLGIPEVGVTVARTLAEHFGRLEGVMDAAEEELQAIHGVGPRMSMAIRSFFSDPRGRGVVEALHHEMSELTVPEPPPSGGPLDGQRWVFTGALESMSRGRARQLVEGLGARTASAVSGETTCVVAGSDAGQKLEQARRLSIPVLNEGEFLDRLRELGVEV